MSTNTAAAMRSLDAGRPSAFATDLCVASRGLVNQIARFLRALHRACFDRYRPERHYMRGPGPRCRAKQGAPTVRLAGV